METTGPRGDLPAVEDPEVDVAALQAEVARAAVARRGAAGGAAASRQPQQPRQPWLLGTADILPHAPLHARVPVTVAVQRAVRRGLRWYLWPVTARLSAHNRAVAGVVEAHRRELVAMRRDAERLAADAALLGERR